ncbi:glucose-6-phosphatase a, catalytic subunit, tandem duplicate 1 [Synchiropus picturatus]
MDLLHSWGIELLVHLQSRYRRYQAFFSLASNVADLHTTFFWFFPIWFHLRQKTSLRLIWVAIIGDWLNLVLKWVLFGERPYWWVHETRFYGAQRPPTVQQFPITCETGPGSPSGHAMGAAGVWYVMITAVLAVATERKCPPLLYRFLWMLLCGLMCCVGLVVCIARVYVAAHFPHQVVAGIMTGLAVAHVVSRLKWIDSATIMTYLSTIAVLTSFTVGFYLLLEAVGVDLLWTIPKAQKWCVKAEWVNFDTTPFASFTRNMGVLFGLGLGLHFSGSVKNPNATFKIGCVISSLVLLQLLDKWTFSSENLTLYYALSFGKSTLTLMIPTTLVPSALQLVIGGRRDDKKL